MKNIIAEGGFISPESVKKVGLVGAGTIGAAWASHFLAYGLNVVVTDLNSSVERKLRASVDKAWPSLVHLGWKKA